MGLALRFPSSAGAAGGFHTTFAATASCPSRKTVAPTSITAPTTDLAGYLPPATLGETSINPIRPATRNNVPAADRRCGNRTPSSGGGVAPPVGGLLTRFWSARLCNRYIPLNMPHLSSRTQIEPLH